MSFGGFFAEVSGSSSAAPGWMSWAVWPFLVLVAVFARSRGR